VNVAKLGVRVKKLTRIRNKGIRIESDQSDLADKLSKCKIFDTEFQLKMPEKRNPRMAVYFVNASWDADQLREYLIKQNDLTADAPIKFLYKFGPRNKPDVHWVVEVDPISRKKLLENGRVYLDFDSCKISDYIRVTRCYNCEGFGHTSLNCKQEVTCAHCAQHHESKSCPNLENTPVR
jgi:hypothetical protein